MDCPDRHELHRRVEREHGGQVPANLAVSARIEHDDAGYHLSGEVALGGRPQSLTLYHGQSCHELARTFALWLAHLLPDPDWMPPSSGASRQRNGYLRGGGEVDLWTLCPGGSCELSPLPAWGVIIGGGWIHRRIRVELTFPLHTAVTKMAEVDTATGTFGAMTTRWFGTGVSVRMCGAIERVRVDLLLCGEVGLQLLFGRPRSVASEFEAMSPMLAWGVVRLAPAFVWWMNPSIGLRLEIAPGVNLHPKDYRVYDRIKGEGYRRPIAEIGWFHTTFGVGLDVRLGKRPET